MLEDGEEEWGLMLTGIQDAHNLAWKLAEAVKRQAAQPNRLLQSYETERKPVAIVSHSASQNGWTLPYMPLLFAAVS